MELIEKKFKKQDKKVLKRVKEWEKVIEKCKVKIRKKILIRSYFLSLLQITINIWEADAMTDLQLGKLDVKAYNEVIGLINKFKKDLLSERENLKKKGA